ncbi:hypothetical protein [Janthinobacterium sp. GMG1]|uniref:hypothetical protein n=1 Tax=Janthinobacterium sp. GMG1 TaxID=3096007 RepID=UPI002ACA8C52|nr:hypothetical protein [Janthinobacterium sp. GMG1]MDZ5631892.1 hypothetical protein [Janthinobacterium sp. GMG1]
MELTNLQESLLVFAGLKNQLEPALRTVKRYPLDDELKFTVTSHLLILVSSFLEEWRRFSGLGCDESVRKTLRSASPAIKRISQWKGIRTLRSTVLAHPFRQKDGSLTIVESLYENNLVSSEYAESILLGECAVYAIATAICQHNCIYEKAKLKYYSQVRSKIPINGIQTMSEFHKEIDRIRLAITVTDPCLADCFQGNSRRPS